jgi:hypothetical protein
MCAKDTAILRNALRALPAGFADLTTDLTRQAKKGGGIGGKSAGIPLPFGFDASWDRDAVILTVTTWIRELAESYGEDLYTHTPVPCECRVPYALTTKSCRGAHIRHDYIPGSTMKSWCEWLIARLHRIRGHQAVEQIVDELLDAERLCRRTADRPAEREFVTTCAICGKGVYSAAKVDDDTWDTWVGCRECKRMAPRDEISGEIVGDIPEYQVGPSRLARLEALKQAVLAERDLLVAVQALRGEPLSPKTFRAWARRYREGVTGATIPPRACSVADVERDDDGRVVRWTALYYVDDALQLAARIPRRAVG